MKDLNTIRQKLDALKRAPFQGHYEYYAGNFKLNIWTNKIQDPMYGDSTKISENITVDVDLFEITNQNSYLYNWVSISRDKRFSEYEPIQYSNLYNQFQCKSDGLNMPILKLCELIKYLYRLSNLSVFT